MNSIIPKEPGRVAQFLIITAAIVIVLAGMKAAESIIVPFLLAGFIAIITTPPYMWLQSKGVPKAISLIIVIFAFLIFISFIGLLIGTSVNDFTSKLPQYQAKLQTQTDAIMVWLYEKGMLEKKTELNEILNPGAVFRLVANTLNEISGMFANGFLILLTMIFILLEVSSLPVKLKKIFSDPDASIERMQSINSNINKYIGIKTLISLATGLSVTILLLIIGVDYPVLWGVLAFVLNFIPNIGSLIATIPPVLLAIVQLGIGEALAVLIGYLVINTVVGNVLEPKFMGTGLGLSTLVVFISLLFWGWLLGPVGMLLSVPLTITLKIILDSSEETRWISVLLGPATDE